MIGQKRRLLLFLCDVLCHCAAHESSACYIIFDYLNYIYILAFLQNIRTRTTLMLLQYFQVFQFFSTAVGKVNIAIA